MDNSTKKNLLEEFKMANPQLLLNDEPYGYYKGYHDAIKQIMQTVNKLIEVGAFNGTKFNSHN